MSTIGPFYQCERCADTYPEGSMYHSKELSVYDNEVLCEDCLDSMDEPPMNVTAFVPELEAEVQELDLELKNLRSLGDICVRRCNTAEARVQELERRCRYYMQRGGELPPMITSLLEEPRSSLDQLISD
jgi:hypothetical protein